MQDFLSQARRAAGGAFERATWEADKMRRMNSRQRDIELLQRERTALLEQLSGVVLDLETRGQLTQPPLRALADRLRSLTNDITSATAEVETIRTEAYAPGATAYTPPRPDALADETEICPTCKQLSRKGATFCANCGARLH